MSEVDSIKQALRMMPYGFYSITTTTDDDVNAMVANWIMQVSFEPRLITIALAKSAHSHTLIEQSRVFGLNIFLSADQEAIKPFTKGRSKKPEKMEGAQFTRALQTGVPILEGAAAYLECRVKDIFDIGGDHDLVVAEVIGGEVFKPAESSEVLTLPALGWSYAG